MSEETTANRRSWIRTNGGRAALAVLLMGLMTGLIGTLAVLVTIPRINSG